MDPNDKERTVRRYLRGTRRLEEKRENLAKRKKRGYGPRGPMRDLEDEFDDFDDAYERPMERREPRRADRRGAQGTPARVASVARTEVRVLDASGAEHVARPTPAVLALGGLVVGDEVLVDDHGRVVERRDRRTVLERRAPGSAHRARLLAANVDVGLVVLAPREGGELSLGFLDRAIAALQAGDVEPCVVVTKLDLASNEKRRRVRGALDPWRATGVDVHLVGSPTGEGIDELRESLRGRVAVLLGHSGVGKSTLVNALDPEAGLATGAVRASDGRGRHTTTASRLVPFVEGGALVDTPGVRQLVPRVTDADELARAVPELAPYLGRCRFHDCAHVGEPGCAVEAAAAEDADVAAALGRLRRLIASSEPQ
ncbi:MAG: ribosome small subunit-dependent GTPase A [Planctomycetota bacterium]